MSVDLVRTLAAAAIAAADPRALLVRALENQSHQNPTIRHSAISVVAAGKASGAMLDALRAARPVGRVVHAAGSHPLPDEASVRAGEAALALAADVRREEGELVVLLSGGASAMLAAPAEGLTLEQKRVVTRRLLASGASIHELNAVRRHLSRIKGGRLALGVRCTTFALSDVTDDDAATIGSGPSVGDPSTLADAIRVLERAGITRDMPEIAAIMQRAGETPKPDAPGLASSRFVLIGGRRSAMDGVAAAALEAGYGTIVFDEPITGDAAPAGAAFAARALAAARRIGGGPVAVIASGETTVRVKGSGTGGRNQEFALGAAGEIEDSPLAIRLIAFGTDGIDGNSPAAGAIADVSTLSRARAAGLDPGASLAANDSHAFFSRLGDLMVTGPTGTNVGDVFVAIIEP